MNSTAGVLRRIKQICSNQDSCLTCKLAHKMCCDCNPEYWDDKDIEAMADIIDDYEEGEE